MEPGLTWTSVYEKYFDAEKALTEYFTADSEFTDESVIQPMRQLEQLLASGSVKGDTLVLYGVLVNIHLLFPTSAYFKEITIMEYLDTNLQYIDNWLKNHPKSFDWTQCLKPIQENQEERQKWIDNEEKTKRLIKNTMKLDVCESGPVAPKSFPQVDCLLIPYTLIVLCKDHVSFISSMKDLSSLLKSGGHLLMFLLMECTYMYIADFKFPMLCVNEDFVRKVLKEEGFMIKEAQTKPRLNETKFSIMDYSSVMFIHAVKGKDVQ
ncbi:nicotinamide N-methyltransferase-like [Lissotriton helveticus]